LVSKKRKRQQRARQARRAYLQAQQRKARRRRQLLASTAVVMVAAMMAGVFLFTGGPQEDDDDGQTTTTSTTSPPQLRQATPEDPCPPPDGSAPRQVSFPRPPPGCIDQAKSYVATVETDAGTFTVELDAEAAPVTVNNFVVLSRYHAYDGVPFHRVVPGFVVQGGDVEKGNGMGGPGYAIPDELPDGPYQLWSVAMANSGPNTSGSQFFVVSGPDGANNLQPNYSRFGRVASGHEVVQRINDDGAADPNPPKVLHRMVRVTVSES
jgi:cyclophilin family peptidyl-prolyl cis-trans isomerase